MTDKEMLEFAAKAAGYVIRDSTRWKNTVVCQVTLDDSSTNYVRWNPLADDGDALRLAVNLRSYGVIISLVSVAQVEVLALRCDSPYEEFEGTDPLAATRRAIVRAAAEIGRQML